MFPEIIISIISIISSKDIISEGGSLILDSNEWVLLYVEQGKMSSSGEERRQC